MRSFAEIWRDATAESIIPAQGAVGELMVVLAENLEVEQIEFANIPPALFFLVDLSSLGFKGMDLNVVMVTHPPRNEIEAHKQASLLGEYRDAVKSFGFCFVIQLCFDPLTENLHIPTWLDPVFLCGRDIERLFHSKQPRAALFEIIRRHPSQPALNH